MIEVKGTGTGRVSGTLTPILTVAQRAQLDAVLADATAGAAPFRPPVARDLEVLRDLERAGFAQWTPGMGSQLTEKGRDLAVALALQDATAEHDLRIRPDRKLLGYVRALSAALDDVTEPELRAEVQADVDRARAEVARRAALAEFAYDDLGRHAAEAFDRTEVFAPVSAPVKPDATVPDLSTVALIDESLWSTVGVRRLLDAVDADATFAGRLRRNLTLPRVAALCLAAGVLLGCGVMWLVAL